MHRASTHAARGRPRVPTSLPAPRLVSAQVTSELELLREEPHKSTGHAFVGFEHEEDKVQLLNQLSPPTLVDL
eukprot:954070-Prymnesium_polylepis.1